MHEINENRDREVNMKKNSKSLLRLRILENRGKKYEKKDEESIMLTDLSVLPAGRRTSYQTYQCTAH